MPENTRDKLAAIKSAQEETVDIMQRQEDLKYFILHHYNILLNTQFCSSLDAGDVRDKKFFILIQNPVSCFQA
jgi:3-oxoacyl-[acyl-carrier-protein] synthase III